MTYPLTIVRDRYSGVYSGGKYTAWNTDFYRVPLEIDSNDTECGAWWDDFDNGKIKLKTYIDKLVYVGKGDTPTEAIENLLKQIPNNF